jgi:hypothetical protein
LIGWDHSFQTFVLLHQEAVRAIVDCHGGKLGCS